MKILGGIKDVLRRSPVAYLWILYKGRILGHMASQSDEAWILKKLTSRHKVPETFIEFGFSGFEFNCIQLATLWEGLLIDTHAYNIKVAKTLFGKNIDARQIWLTNESLNDVIEWAERRTLGVLSIDVDGNDYWFLKRLIHLKPAIIVAEYNSSFGSRPIAVLYDADIDRTRKHSNWLYYGASLSAMHHLCAQNGYSLIEVSNSGVNAFFIRNDLLTVHDRPLSPEFAWREKFFEDGSRTSEQWEQIKHLEFVDVTSIG